MKRYIQLITILAVVAIGFGLLHYFTNNNKKQSRSIIKCDLSSSSNEIAFKKRYLGNPKENQAQWKGSFTFVQAADPQFGLIDRYIYKKNNITWDKEIRLLRLVINDVNKLTPKPKFFVISGDLVDAYPSQPEMRRAQIDDLKNVLQELDPEIKLVCLCGNHDIGNAPTQDNMALYNTEFGDDYFSFWYGGVKFLVLNSQYFFNSTFVSELKAEQDEWIKSELTKEGWTHLIIFQHIPWFLREPNEDFDNYFNIPLDERSKWLETFKNAGVAKIFSGHLHRNTGGFYENIEMVVTSAIGAQAGSDKHGYRLVQVDEGEIKHTYINVTDVVNE